MKRESVFLFVLWVMLCLTDNVFGVEQLHITFDPASLPGGSKRIDVWTEKGVRFVSPQMGHTDPSVSIHRPDNGTAHLSFASGGTLVFQLTDLTPFHLLSVDLAEYSTVFPTPRMITFVGHKTNGLAVVKDFMLDGIIDGSGPLADFETFTFGEEFTNVSYVEVPTYRYSMDNVFLMTEPAILVGLEIVGPDEVAEDFRASYKAIAYYDDDSTRDVTNLAEWSVEPNTAANIDENGVLTTKDIVKDRSATILASYTEGNVTFEAEKAIDILAICPTGTALQFDGQDDYADLGNDSSLKPPLPVTLSAWIKLSGSGDNMTFMNLDDQAYKYYGIWFNVRPDNNKLHISYGDGTAQASYARRSKNGTTPLSTGTWYHVAAVVRGPTDMELYVDGEDDRGTYAGTGGSLAYSGGSSRIGGRDFENQYFNGQVDDVRVYDRALSAEEIRANMHRRLTGDEPGLVGYWDFDEGEGQIVYDLSGNGNDGQLGSTPNVDTSDPTWVDSDAPIGICTLYQIATMAADRAVERKLAMLEELLAALAEEWVAYEALEELLESEDYEDLDKGDIVKAKQKIHSATQHQEQVIDALEKSIEKLKDALSALGYEPEPPPPPPGQASNPNPADGATGVSPYANLSWTAGPNAVSHDVYFGTTSPGTFRGNQTATTFDPGTMATYTTYYWRIDEVNPSWTTTGTVWSFTTGGGGPPR